MTIVKTDGTVIVGAVFETDENGEQKMINPGRRVEAHAMTKEIDGAALEAAHEILIMLYRSDIFARVNRDAVATIIAKHLTTSRADGWQPIETAPKDGTPVELKGVAGPYGVTEWKAVARWSLPTNWPRKDATWADVNGAVLRLAGYVPTHWRPRPAAPLRQQGG